MSDPVEPPSLAPRFYVEAHPGGGWTVRLPGHPAPVSRHDTEEEARAKAAAYQRGAADAALEDGAGDRSQNVAPDRSQDAAPNPSPDAAASASDRAARVPSEPHAGAAEGYRVDPR